MMLMRSHVDEDDLELFVMERLPQSKRKEIEAHISVCSACRSRLMETEDFIQTLRSALSPTSYDPLLSN